MQLINQPQFYRAWPSLDMSHPPLLRLLSYATHYRTQIWSAITCSILNTIFDLAPPDLIGVAIDVVNDVVNEKNL